MFSESPRRINCKSSLTQQAGSSQAAPWGNAWYSWKQWNLTRFSTKKRWIASLWFYKQEEGHRFPVSPKPSQTYRFEGSPQMSSCLSRIVPSPQEQRVTWGVITCFTWNSNEGTLSNTNLNPGIPSPSSPCTLNSSGGNVFPKKSCACDFLCHSHTQWGTRGRRQDLTCQTLWLFNFYSFKHQKTSNWYQRNYFF